MEPMKGLVCGLPAFGFKPQLSNIPQVPQHNYKEAYEDERNDVEEITELQFRRNCGYLVRVEVPEEDIEPIYHDAIRKMKNASNSAPRKHPKQEHGQSSKGKAPRLD